MYERKIKIYQNDSDNKIKGNYCLKNERNILDQTLLFKKKIENEEKTVKEENSGRKKRGRMKEKKNIE